MPWPSAAAADDKRNPILQRSHDELRAALRIAGKEIRSLNFGKADTPVLEAAAAGFAGSAAKAERGAPWQRSEQCVEIFVFFLTVL